MNIAQALLPRVKLIMWHVSYRKRGNRFEGFDPKRHAVDFEFRSNSEVLYWVRPNQPGLPYLQNERFAQVALANIDFKSLRNVVLSKPRKLAAKKEDAQVLVRDNRKGTAPLQTTYTGTFSETVSESTRFAAEMKIGIKATLGTEGAVSASVEAYSEFTTTFEKAGGRDQTVSRTIEDSFSVPPGERWTLTGQREVGQMERTATGNVDLSHNIFIGSYQSHHGGRDRWDWNYSWGSFTSFMDVVKQESPGAMWDEFKNQRLGAEHIAQLEQPTSAEIVRSYTYPNVTFSSVDVAVEKAA